ncbi:hypothetical protein M8542_43345 [Amycolatopsis sp. OK19-0408]|uniref:DUF3592 domain-containing protein n=1 Tax=Amycolatopsis iheyensis TaxID=2945988 RepID=A0A9X2SP99_9PSEU|nr:hypothetical protein [Amycolatopsis iheyensis]MCR6489669.1 hypothetical protein [Amycolatopsis iheyensis]
MGTGQRGGAVGAFAILGLLALALAGVFGAQTYDETRSRVLPARVTAVDDAHHRVTVAYTAPDGTPATRTVSTGTAKPGRHPVGRPVELRYWPETGRVDLDEGIPPVAGLAVAGAFVPIAAVGFAVSLRRMRARS